MPSSEANQQDQPNSVGQGAASPVTCLIGLGANLGDRVNTLDRAVELLAELPKVSLVGHSDWLETLPIGGPNDQDPFLNGAAVVETTLSAEECLANLHGIETQMGRERRVRWAARTLDIDLLLYGQQHIESDAICVPHPRMAFRPFVLEPAAQVGPDIRHPLLDATLRELLTRLNDGEDQVVLTGGIEEQRRKVVPILEPLLPSFVGLQKTDTPKLQVSLDWPIAELKGVPTLWLDPTSTTAKHETELRAAIECVWPATAGSHERS